MQRKRTAFKCLHAESLAKTMQWSKGRPFSADQQEGHSRWNQQEAIPGGFTGRQFQVDPQGGHLRWIHRKAFQVDPQGGHSRCNQRGAIPGGWPKPRKRAKLHACTVLQTGDKSSEDRNQSMYHHFKYHYSEYHHFKYHYSEYHHIKNHHFRQ